MAWGEPQRRVINADTVARQFEDWYNGLPGRELEVGSTTVEPDPPNSCEAICRFRALADDAGPEGWYQERLRASNEHKHSPHGRGSP